MQNVSLFYFKEKMKDTEDNLLIVLFLITNNVDRLIKNLTKFLSQCYTYIISLKINLCKYLFFFIFKLFIFFEYISAEYWNTRSIIYSYRVIQKVLINKNIIFI